MFPFLGQQALNERSNPTINAVVYFHTELTATTAKTLKRLGTSHPKGVGTRGFFFRYNINSLKHAQELLQLQTKLLKLEPFGGAGIVQW